MLQQQLRVAILAGGGSATQKEGKSRKEVPRVGRAWETRRLFTFTRKTNQSCLSIDLHR